MRSGDRIVAIDGVVAEASRAQLKGALGELLAVLDAVRASEGDYVKVAIVDIDGGALATPSDGAAPWPLFPSSPWHTTHALAPVFAIQPLAQPMA